MSFIKNMKYLKNAELYREETRVETLQQMILFDKYMLLLHEMPELTMKHYPTYYAHLMQNVKNVINYKKVSPYFISIYVMINRYVTRNEEYATVKIFASDASYIETMLYINLGKQLNMTQYNLDVGNTESTKRVHDNNIKKLMNIYGNNFKTEEMRLKKYDGMAIEELKKKEGKTDIFIYSSRTYSENTGIKTHDLQLFFYTVLSLNILNEGGVLILRLKNNPETHIEQIFQLLDKYFKKIDVVRNKLNRYYPELIVVCEELLESISEKDNKILLLILDEWDEKNPNGGIKLSYTDEKLRKKYGIMAPYTDEHTNMFVTSILKFKTETERSRKLITKVEQYKKKFYKKIKKKFQRVPKKMTDDILIKSFDANYLNYLNAAIEICLENNLLVKPEYEKRVINYENKVMNETVTMPSSTIIQIFDYSRTCDMDLREITNVYYKKNREKEEKTPITIGSSLLKTKQTERYAAIRIDVHSTKNLLIMSSEYIEISREISKDGRCKENFEFRPESYKYDKNVYTLDNYGFKRMKQLLNLYKLNIDALGGRRWSRVSHSINIPRSIVYYIKNEYNINISRGFAKMYEMCVEFNLVDFTKKGIKTFHISEAPGHFINAMNHYIKGKDPEYKFDWYGNSLNPYNKETKRRFKKDLFGDNYGYIKRYRKRWLWGKDETGDITSRENILNFKERMNYSVDVLTSDCGIATKTKEEYFNQEQNMAKLNLCQCLIALLTVKKGGTGVLKMFLPFSESITLSIIFLVFKHFGEAYFMKQVSGGYENSEVYLVLKNKIEHPSKELEAYLLDCVDNFNPNEALFPQEIYEDYISNKFFVLQMEKVTEKFIHKQIKSLVRSFYYVDNPNVLEAHKPMIGHAKKANAKTWIKNMKFGPITEDLQL